METPSKDVETRTIIITMPDSESAFYVLRCAYNAIASKMFECNTNSDIYIKCMTEIKESMDKGSLQILKSGYVFNCFKFFEIFQKRII